ncbi:MAG: fumarylacetoacetase [Actinomycetota bacterium]|nr:fumarylacetoacetase [Actinomycetota bacterium]
MNDTTIDPLLASWVPVPIDSDFPIQNLPFGVFRTDRTRVGVAIGNHILDLAAVQAAEWFDNLNLPEDVFAQATLNQFIELGQHQWRAVRGAVSALLTAGDERIAKDRDRYLVARDAAKMILPIDIGDYVDFYSSIEHATNVGQMFRPDAPPLLPNWRHLPVGYHGRTSSIVVSGTPVVRPHGQRPGPNGPTFGPSQRLDIELEVGFVTGTANQLGTPLPIGQAEEHIFGVCLINDWSARDIQAWEYQPLGPYLGKSFATTMSPWVITLDALAPFRVVPPPQDPAPLPYLSGDGATALDLDLEIELNGEVISRTSFRNMYWTMAQQLAHAASNGTNIRAGDLYGSGTVSGSTPDSLGSLLELSWNATRPIELSDGSTRTFLEDGDTVALNGRCQAEGFTRIGFGDCTGTVLPAVGGEN